MEHLKGVTIGKYDYVIKIDLNEFEDTPESISELEKMRINFLINNAPSLNAVITGADFEFEFENEEEKVTDYEAVEMACKMTIAELKEYSLKIAHQKQLKNQINSLLLNIPILSENELSTLVRRLYPELTEQDIFNIYATISRLVFCYSHKIQTIEYFVDLVLATKNSNISYLV